MPCSLLFVIQFYIANGFYVAIDFHGQGLNDVDCQVVSDTDLFIENWLRLLKNIQSLPTYDEHIKGTYPSHPTQDLLNFTAYAFLCHVPLNMQFYEVHHIWIGAP